MRKVVPEESERTRSYVDEVFRQIIEKPDIEDIVILNKSGNPVKSTMGFRQSVKFAGLYEALRAKTERGLHKINPRDKLEMIRVRTRAQEVLITPDGKITVIVVQNATDQYQK